MADMFLNWVYRSLPPNALPTITSVNSLGGEAIGCESDVRGNWNGFLNVNWNSDPNLLDNGLPGDVRLVYIQSLIVNQMNARGW